MRKFGRGIPVVIAAALAIALFANLASAGSNLPADKMTVSASQTSVQGPNTTVPVLTAKVKTSNTADLLFTVPGECSILSQITNMGSETQAYTAQVRLTIKDNGNVVPPVPNATGNGASSGSGGTGTSVVFCNREFKRTTVYDTSNESIKDIENTESANAFQWVELNAGATVHNIEVDATFSDTNGADTFAHGVLSTRALTVIPTSYFISQPSA